MKGDADRTLGELEAEALYAWADHGTASGYFQPRPVIYRTSLGGIVVGTSITQPGPDFLPKAQSGLSEIINTIAKMNDVEGNK